jgi:hypothetical protein
MANGIKEEMGSRTRGERRAEREKEREVEREGV